MTLRRQQIAFFSFVILVPSAVLMAFGVLLFRQEDRLEEVRREERMEALGTTIANTLEDSLAGLHVRYAELLREEGYVFDGGLHGFDASRIGALRPMIPLSPFGAESPAVVRALIEARREAARSAAAALRGLDRSRRTASGAAARAVLDLERARLLADSDRGVAEAVLWEVTRTPLSEVDEAGVPWAFYGLGHLVGSTDQEARLDSAFAALGASSAWLTSAGERFLARFEERLAAESPIKTRHAILAAVESLSEEERRRGIALRVPWLLSVQGGDAGSVWVVPLSVLASWHPELDGVTTDGEGVRLSGFPNGLGVRINPSVVEPVVSRKWLLALGLLLVGGLAGFGAVLMWRDLQREKAMTARQKRFVSSVSHELRTPLTSIRTYADGMLRYSRSMEEKDREQLAVISAESARLTRLLNNVLDSSRIEAGEMSWNLRPDRFSEAIRRAVETMRFQAEQDGVQISFEEGTGEGEVLMDRDAIEQAALNLLSNAIKYGSSTVRVRTEAVSGMMVLTVSDDGWGIQPSDAKRIFEPFYRSEPRAENRTTGTGLGLAMVKAIAEAHGGSVTVESTPGTGSSFTFSIPAS